MIRWWDSLVFTFWECVDWIKALLGQETDLDRLAAQFMIKRRRTRKVRFSIPEGNGSLRKRVAQFLIGPNYNA